MRRKRIRTARQSAIEECVQVALLLRDEADNGKWTDASGDAWAMGFGFAANLIGARLFRLMKRRARA